MADMFTSISPMNFGFNNPIKFNDPTGLAGEGDDDENTVDLPTHTVTAPSLVHERDFSSILNGFSYSHNPIIRNLASVVKNEGVEEGQQLINRGDKLNFNYYEKLKYREMNYLNGFRIIYNFGISGTMVVMYGAPILIENLGFSIKATFGERAILTLGDLFYQSVGNYSIKGIEGLKYIDFGDALLTFIGANLFTSSFLGGAVDFTPFQTQNIGGVVGVNKPIGNALFDAGTSLFSGTSSDLMNSVNTNLFIINLYNLSTETGFKNVGENFNKSKSE